jgi:hypothetical protein
LVLATRDAKRFEIGTRARRDLPRINGRMHHDAENDEMPPHWSLTQSHLRDGSEEVEVSRFSTIQQSSRRSMNLGIGL